MFCVAFFISFLSNSDGILQIVLDKNRTFSIVLEFIFFFFYNFLNTAVRAELNM